MQAFDPVAALVQNAAQPAVVTLLAGGGDGGMHRAATVAPGDLLDAAFQGAGDVGLIDDVEGTEGVGEEDRAAWVKDFAKMYNMEEKTAREALGKAGKFNDIDETLIEQKVLAFIKENSKISS